MPANKLLRKKRKAQRDASWTAFTRNKWNGKEPIADFNAREQKLFNGLTASKKKV